MRGPGQFYRELQSRQGRAQFVRYVAQESSLAHDQPLQAFRHLIERPAQLADFVGAICTDTRGQIALPELSDGRRDTPNRRDDADGRQPTKNPRDADDKEVIGKKGPDMRRAQLTFSSEPVLRVFRSMRKGPTSMSTHTQLVCWRCGKHPRPIRARDQVRSFRIEQIMRSTEDAVEACQVVSQAWLSTVLERSACALQLQFVELEEGWIDLNPLHTVGDQMKGEERQRKDADHRQHHTDVEGDCGQSPKPIL